MDISFQDTGRNVVVLGRKNKETLCKPLCTLSYRKWYKLLSICPKLNDASFFMPF